MIIAATWPRDDVSRLMAAVRMFSCSAALPPVECRAARIQNTDEDTSLRCEEVEWRQASHTFFIS